MFKQQHFWVEVAQHLGVNQGDRDYQMAPKWTISQASWRYYDVLTDVFEVDDDDDYDEPTLGLIFQFNSKYVFIRKMTVFNH